MGYNNPDTHRAWYESHRRELKSKALYRRHKITLVQLEEQWKDQGFKCAICGTKDLRGRSPYVDHDHSCCPEQKTCGGCLRGLLCFNCNANLGWYEARKEAVDSYLEKWRK